jgi:hypothetical protein
MHQPHRTALTTLAQVLARLLDLSARPGDRHSDRRDERGDVPGWVLVTVMTAGLCAALYGLADDQLSRMLTDALNKVR